MEQKYICAINRCPILDDIDKERCKCYDTNTECPIGHKPIWITLMECDKNE